MRYTTFKISKELNNRYSKDYTVYKKRYYNAKVIMTDILDYFNNMIPIIP